MKRRIKIEDIIIQKRFKTKRAKNVNKKALKTVFLDTVPVMTGYLFLGISFGILLGETGYGLGWAFCMALFMYAGSAQFLSVSLLASHASLLSTGIAVFLLNARHIFYGISLIDAYKGTGKKKPPVKVLPAQNFPQRDYSSVDNDMMSDLEREIAAMKAGEAG